jgi:hypothetical protein
MEFDYTFGRTPDTYLSLREIARLWSIKLDVENSDLYADDLEDFAGAAHYAMLDATN